MSDTYARGGAHARDDADARRNAYGRADAYAGEDAYASSDGLASARQTHARDAAHASDQRPARLGAYAREQAYVWRDPRARASAKRRKGSAGGIIVALVALFSAVVVIVGLVYATGAGERRRVLLAEGDCAPVASLNTRGLDCTLESQLAQQYTQMTTPAAKQMVTYAGAYAASELHNLAAAEGILTAEIAVENSLDASLRHFTFPPVFAAATNKLIGDNEALARLTAKQERSSSLGQMQSFDGRVQAASTAVNVDLALVGKDLAKPPTPSEFIGNGG